MAILNLVYIFYAQFYRGQSHILVAVTCGRTRVIKKAVFKTLLFEVRLKILLNQAYFL
jgi:hypothetical protein